MAEGGDSVDSGRKLVVGRRNKPSDISSLYMGSEEVEPVLCREHGQEFKQFCKTHMTELCITCRRMEHKNCKTVIDIKQAAATIYSDCHGEKITQSVKDLIERFSDCKVAAEELKTKFSHKRELAVNKVKQSRKAIDDYLDELETKSISEIDRKLKEKTKAVEEHIHVCNASLSSLSTSSSGIDKTISVGNKEDKFIAINRATKQTQQYCNVLLEMYREMSDISVKFTPNTAFTDILHSLGTLSVETSRTGDIFTDITPIYTGEMKVKQAGDKKPLVASFDVLQDGRKLVLDIASKMIQLYDQNSIFLTETVLPLVDIEEIPCVVIISSTEAQGGSALRGSLLKVKIGDELAVSEIMTNYDIFIMTKYGEDILCLLDDHKQVQLCVIDKNMTKTKKIILKNDRTMLPVPLAIGVSDDKCDIYILDNRKGCYGITLGGQIVFHYQNPEAKSYRGLVVDSDGLFIGSWDGSDYQVEKLNFRGERKEVYSIFGNSIPLKIVESELVVFQRDGRDRYIRFYFLLK